MLSSIPDRRRRNTKKERKIPRPISNGLTYSLINCIEPGKSLTNMIDNELLHKKDVINEPFLMSLYQHDVHNQDAFFFVHKNESNDGEKVFRIYRDNHHAADKFYGHLVIVNDINKFNELANKTSPGYATKNGDMGDDFKGQKYLSYFYQGKYRMLNRERVCNALKVPAQHRSWSCGPNSGLRSIYLLNETSYKYDSWVECSPKRICKKTTTNNGGKVFAAGWGMTAVGALFAPVTGGLSLLPGAATAAVGWGTAAAGVLISSDVGPTPEQLASYLSKHMKSHKASVMTYKYRSTYEKYIADDIDNGNPRIVLFIMSTFDMHYMNVIGYKKNKKSNEIEEWVLLDTKKSVGYMTASNFRYWLDHDCASWLLEKYNTVKFCQR